MWGVNCLIRCGTYLKGGALGTWRRTLNAYSMGPCERIEDTWVEEHTSWRLVVDPNKYVEEKYWSIVTTWHTC